MVKIKNYTEKRSKGLIKVIKAGGGYALATKEFNPETGDELDPIIESIDLEVIIAEKEALKVNIDEYNVLINDIKGTPAIKTGILSVLKEGINAITTRTRIK